jgi:cell division protein FtsN
MAKDYKSSDRRPGGKSGHPLMTGVFIGVLAGLCAALAVALYLAKAPTPVVRDKPAEAAKPVEKPGPLTGLPQKPPQPTSGQQNEGKERFQFYEILPGKKEPAAEQGAKREGQQAGVLREVMYLQAGAFQKSSDADNLKARLALAGLEAQIQTATRPDHSVWHRVRLGPFSNMDELEKVRAALRENKIEPSIIKEKEPLAKR